MSNVLLEIAIYLESKKVAKRTVDMFINMMPSSVNKGVLIKNSLAGVAIDHELKGFVKADFQLIVRSPNYQEGEALINKISQILDFKTQTLGDTNFNFCRPRNYPIAFPISEGNLFEFSVYFDFCTYE